jgi:hypothetical protein
MRGSWPIEFSSFKSTKHKPIYSFYLFSSLLQRPCCSSLDLTIMDGALGLSADLGQPADVRARASTVSLLVCLKTSRFFITQVRLLSFSGLLVNLSILHHERVRSSLCSSVRSGPVVQCPSGVWFGPHPTSTRMWTIYDHLWIDSVPQWYFWFVGF